MSAQKVFRTDDKKTRKRYELFIRVYSVALTSILNWLVEEAEDLDPEEFHTMLGKLRYEGFYSVLNDWRIRSTHGTPLS